MARIPTVPGVSGRLRPARTSPLRLAGEVAGIAREVDQATLVVRRFHEEREAARRQHDLSATVAQAHRELGDLGLEAMKLPAREAEAYFNEQAGERVEGIAATIPDRIVRENFLVRSAGILETRRFAVARDAFTREQQEARLDLTENILPSFARSYALAQTDLERQQALDGGGRSILGSAFLSDAEKEDYQRRFATLAEIERTKFLLNEGRLAEARAYIGNREITTAVDESQRRTLLDAVEAAESERHTRRQRALAEANLSSATDLVQRLYDRNDPRGYPTIPEILEMPLTPNVMEHFVGLVRDGEGMAQVTPRNPALFNELFRRVHDPRHGAHITDANELLGYIGHGIGPEDYEALRADIEQLRNPDQQRIDKLFTDFLDQAEGRITFKALNLPDPRGEELFYDFRFEADRLFRRGVEAGKDPFDLLDPRKPDYIGRIVPRYMRTPLQQAKDFADMMESIGEDLEVEGRQEGESMEDYFRRTGAQ